MKTDKLLLADVCENFLKKSTKDSGINHLYRVSICSYTLQCCLKYTDNKLQTLQEMDMSLLIENIMRGWLPSVMGDRYVKSDEDK